MVQVGCDGVGPVLMVSPRSLDWGTVPVLCCVEKYVAITNESEIEANFSAFMVTTLTSFCVEIFSCSVCLSF